MTDAAASPASAGQPDPRTSTDDDDAGTSEAPADLTNARIKVKGKVNLGQGLDLVQRPVVAPQPAFRFAVGRPDDGSMPAIDDPNVVTAPGRLPTQELEYALVEAARQVDIEDDGLTTSYGIFGAPRAGKTHLLIYMLRQIAALKADKPAKKFGGMILDPKAAVIEDVRALMKAAGREPDLLVLNTEELAARGESMNIIDCALEPHELGRALVLAAQGAGVAASEPFWFIAWSNLFGAAMYLLDWLGEDVITVAELTDAVLDVVPGEGPDGSGERRIQRLAREGRELLDGLPDDKRRDAEQAINQVEGFYRQEPDNIATVEALISRAYSGLQQSRYAVYSPRVRKVPGERRTTLYDRIIDEGLFVLVAVSPSDPSMAKTVCTLVKCLFEQAVLSRLARVRAGTLRNFKRPLVLACDEYSDIATEVPGEPMGDGYFFSLSRQNGCMGIIATQSVNMLQASSLKENWKAVFSNFGAKIFLRLADNETAEEATKLVGETDWYMTSLGSSREKDGMGSSSQRELRERKALPVNVLTQVLQRRQAVIVGSLDGGNSQPDTRFLQTPDYD